MFFNSYKKKVKEIALNCDTCAVSKESASINNSLIQNAEAGFEVVEDDASMFELTTLLPNTDKKISKFIYYVLYVVKKQKLLIIMIVI